MWVLQPQVGARAGREVSQEFRWFSHLYPQLLVGLCLGAVCASPSKGARRTGAGTMPCPASAAKPRLKGPGMGAPTTPLPSFSAPKANLPLPSLGQAGQEPPLAASFTPHSSVPANPHPPALPPPPYPDPLNPSGWLPPHLSSPSTSEL